MFGPMSDPRLHCGVLLDCCWALSEVGANRDRRDVGLSAAAVRHEQSGRGSQ